jgi:hypothetical protein
MSVRSVPFMELPTAPWILFGLLLFLGALNFQLVRHGEASSILSSLKRFGEAEIGIGVTVILAAASLTSLPPAADLTQDRVSGAEIYAHDSASAASLKSCQERSARRSLCRPKKGLRDGIAFHGLFCPRAIRHAPQHSRREGLVRVQPSLGGDHRSFRRFLAVLAQTRRISWVSNWPLLFLGLSIFLFLRSDPGRLAARPKRLLGHVCGSRGLVAPHLCGAGRRPSRIRMARTDWPRRICQHPTGVPDAHRGLWRAVAHAFPQPRQCERRSSGRVESHPAGDSRGDGRLVALARASPSSGRITRALGRRGSGRYVSR